MIVLKNNKGTDEVRARHLDYGVQISGYFYKRLLEKKNISLFSPSDVPGLFNAYYSNQDEFARLYEQYEADDNIPRITLPAMEVFQQIYQERANTGRIYIMNVDHVNNHGPFDSEVAPITMSNLCVSGDTKILTDQGFVEMKQNVGKKFNVWNGFEWSEDVEIVQTNKDQELYRVHLSDGRFVDCTEYHKWFIYEKSDKFISSGRPNNVIKARTKDLRENNIIQIWDTPVINGTFKLEKPYSTGFYSADGCFHDNVNILYFYNEKKSLLPHVQQELVGTISESDNRIILRTKDLGDKYFVPDARFDIESRLKWFAGYMDGDGTVLRNNNTELLSFTTINKSFAYEVMDMLLSLGVRSRININKEAGVRPMPDGKGGTKDYPCKETYRVVIATKGVKQLLQLGIKFNRLKLNEEHEPNRSCTHYVRIKKVEKLEGLHDTYCVHEPKRNSVIFNGVLTGNCAEIALPTKPLTNILDENGEIALCTLAAVNLGELESLDELENLQDLLVRALDAILDYQDYPVPAAKTSTRKYRPLGIGVINYAYYLAKNHSSYMDPRGNDLTHRTFEAFEYYAIKASVQLAKEKGACEAFENTRWAQGKMPIDRYKKEVDEVHNEPLHLNWDTLREDVVKHGIRNATLTALMPSESSSTVSNATNGIEPPRYHVTVKSNKDMTVKQLVPNFKKDGYRVQTAWELSDMSGYIEKVAIMQKFICQSISANTWYKPSNYPNGLLPMKVIIADQVKAYRLGIKTWYYHNTHDDASDDSHQDDCAGGACKI